MTDAAEDAELVRRVATGEERAAAERAFCQRYAARIRRYAERHLRDPDAVLDLTQQALLGVIEAMRAGRIDDPARLGAFVLSTCRHLSWDANRAAARQERVRRALGAEPLPMVELSDSSLDSVRLGHCLSRLAERERSVVLLTYCEDWPGPRIADELGTTAGNVRVLRHRAIEKLWACLERSVEG
ncbi:MAG: sigma-70 family RNA polymerase sigma factor [Polyangiaceae bacterium]|nr:sigma-70 family RNA polymerase sigma factor [Polyangiaceae bacterium]